ncbi:Synaptobrevin family protein [Histomonas meleagridis]|uniref:Synaptobrevin family protein n=1 Tax=Histomonas meleagridis TaxID=135588 RepID=UPI003559E3CE|nr:Synaptobrevin family protein [Histomonas meleagridis]KAH0802280.1 Synaptobrevin family protein [Histomonas meleagridis]
MSTTFVYGLVAHSTTPLADYSSFEGNFRTIAVKVLENIDPNIPTAISEQGQYVFQTLTEPDKMTYLCLTDKEAIATLRSNFLTDLRNKWRKKYGNNGAKFTAYSKSAEFSSDIRTLFNTYNSERARKIAYVKESQLKTNEQTVQNLKLALQRGEQLEVMSQKADKIKDSATAFHREASKVKSMMCWQKWRFRILIIVIVIILVLAICMIICGPTFSKC